VREVLRQLVVLQGVDETRHRLHAELEAIPAQRAGLDAAEAAARDHVARARATFEAAQLELRQVESTLRDQESLKVRLEGQQSQVKTNIAYTALLHEIEGAAGAISETETRILELMDAVQGARREVEEAERELARAEGDLRERRQALEARSEELAKEQARAEAERAGLAAGIESTVLARYERILERRRPALALVEHGICMGCRMGVPPQRIVEIRAGHDLVTCGSCRRILVLPLRAGEDRVGPPAS
jgi:predicted  nucleic acid-binding Zn-ribbon protein